MPGIAAKGPVPGAGTKWGLELAGIRGRAPLVPAPTQVPPRVSCIVCPASRPPSSVPRNRLSRQVSVPSPVPGNQF